MKIEVWNEKYLLLVNKRCIQMNLFHNECCFQWDWECLVKSNQIKSYFPISHIPYFREYNLDIPEFEWVKEDLNNHQNTINISFQFISIYITYFSWLMYCHNFHDHWWLLCDYLDYHLQEFYYHWMKWYVILEDLEWEMKMKWKWIIITYFQIQLHDISQMNVLQK